MHTHSFKKRWLGAILILILSLILLAGCKSSTPPVEAKGFAIDDDIPFDEHDYEAIVHANNQLGLDLMQTIEADEQNNRFISPLSLFSALSMAYMGAEGETKEEMARMMHIESLEDDLVQKGHASLYHVLATMPEDMTLHNANALWIDEAFTPKEDYKDMLDAYYNATMESDDFSKEATVDRMNVWIEDQTNELIQDMIESPINESVMLILLNTLYFQGDWMYPFDEEQTKDGTFSTDERSIQVPMMQLTEDLQYMQGDDYEAVVLPYEDGEIEMNVFLPKEDVSLDELLGILAKKDWKEWKNGISKQPGTIELPSFEMEYESMLNSPLQQLGMEKAFSDQAEFPLMVQETDALSIDMIKQKSVIIVDEKGTEAASATSVEMEETSASLEEPFHMEVNRPFLFTITESTTGTVLFSGAVNDPRTLEE